MSKNIVILSSSFRKNSNSDALANAFAEGARKSGNNVEKIDLVGKRIEFCRGCMACGTTKRCVIADDAVAIAEKMKTADVLVFATPVYYYSVCGQLKTMLDRANPLYDTDYAFRSVYLLATAAEDESYTVEGATKAVEGWVDCFERAALTRVIFAGGVTAPGDIKDHPALAAAFAAGKAIG